MKKFEELTEREVLALAIALEEEDERVYSDFAEGLRQDYPATASMFEGMREEESGHRRRLLELYRTKFGEHIPLIRRQDVRGFVERPALWLVRPLRIEAVRKEASTMEVETRRFYEKAAARTQDASIRQLLDDLATEEREHENRAQELDKQKLPANVKADEEVAQRRLFVLQIVQPGLAGLMDGSVSTLAPVFAAALATKNSWDAFLVGLAASAGAGISVARCPIRRAISDTQAWRPPFDFRFGCVGEIGTMALACVNDQHLGAAGGLENRAARRDRRREKRDVVPEGLAKASRLEKVPLHVDDDERRLVEIDG